MISSKPSILSAALLLSLAGVASVVTGCTTSSDQVVAPRLSVVNQAMSGIGVTAITGTYTNCAGRSGGWTLGVPDGGDLTVRQGDTDCVLTVENVVTDDATYIGNPAIALSQADVFAASASAFSLVSAPNPTFYGNAKISALDFAADFTVTLLVSDLPDAVAIPSQGATLVATQGGSAVLSDPVPASDYTIDFTTLGVVKDESQHVFSTSGYAGLTAHMTDGQDYAVYAGASALTVGSTFADVDAAWGASTSHPLSDLSPALQIPASDFALGGTDLSVGQSRAVIIRNTIEGVASYQLFLVSFGE